MLERFNAGAARGAGHQHRHLPRLGTVLRGLDAVYNGRRQRLLKELSPTTMLRQRLDAAPALANPTFKPTDARVSRRALRTVANAKEVSHPDTLIPSENADGSASAV